MLKDTLLLFFFREFIREMYWSIPVGLIVGDLLLVLGLGLEIMKLSDCSIRFVRVLSVVWSWVARWFRSPRRESHCFLRNPILFLREEISVRSTDG